MPNRPFSFYFRNDGGIAKILGVEPVDNNYSYHIKPGSGSIVEKDRPVKIDVQAMDENMIKKGEFSFVIKYADLDGEMYKLTVHVKKMSIKSMNESTETGLHSYSH